MVSLRFQGEFLFPKAYQHIADELAKPNMPGPGVTWDDVHKRKAPLLMPLAQDWPESPQSFYYFYHRPFNDSQFAPANGVKEDVTAALYLKNENVPFAYQATPERYDDKPETFADNASTPIPNTADTDTLIAGKIALGRSFVWVPPALSNNPFQGLPLLQAAP